MGELAALLFPTQRGVFDMVAIDGELRLARIYDYWLHGFGVSFWGVEFTECSERGCPHLVGFLFYTVPQIAPDVEVGVE
jgi:hypothetical protein